MQVCEIKNGGTGALTGLEFINTGDENFKESIRAYVTEHFPDITMQEFFERLREFSGSRCCLDMTESSP